MNLDLKPIFRYPRTVIFLVTLATIISLFPLARLKPDNSIDVWFHPLDKTFRDYKRFKTIFGNDANIVIIYRDRELFSEEQLELNRRLAQRLSEIGNVRDVISLTNVQGVKYQGLSIRPSLLVDEQCADPEKCLEEAVRNPVLIDNVVSQDGTATAITLELNKIDDESNEASIKEIRRILSEPGFERNRYHLVGGIPIWVEMNRISNRESITFVAINIFVIFLLLWLILRSIKCALLPLFVAIISTVCTMGLYAVHNTLNMVSGIIPLIILVISIADAVHILYTYQTVRTSSLSSREAIARVLKELYLPCLFTSLTTAVAFLSFLFSPIPPLQLLGLYTAFGVLLAYFLTFTFLPALVVTLDLNSSIPTKKSTSRKLRDWLLELPPWISRQANPIIFAGGIIMVIAVFGVQRLRFETDQIRYLRPANPVRHALDLAQQWFHGIYPLEIVLSAGEKGHFYSIVNLLPVQELEKHITEDNMVETVFSPLTFLRQAGKDLTKNEERGFPLPERNRNLKWTSSTNINYMQRFLSSEGDQLRLSVRSRWLNSKQLEELLKRLRATVEPLCSKAGLSGYFTGFSIMYVDLNHRLIKSQINSFAISFVLIFIMFFLLSKRLSLAVLGMIPNLLPVLTTLGIMGWLDVELDVATVLIAAISLGIAIDDTIHLIHAYLAHQKTGESVPESLAIALHHVGRPLVFTSVVLIGGFSIMMFSSFLPIFYFGVFVSLNMLFALLYDLILLPALLNSYDRLRHGFYSTPKEE